MKSNKIVFNLLLNVSIVSLLLGCKKGFIEDQSGTQFNTGSRSNTSNTLSPPDIYVAGSINGQAVYWKNGTPVTLSGGESANGIAVAGTDVYVCGWGYNTSTFHFVAKYWKNGVLTDLSDGTEDVIASGIALSGSDVYVTLVARFQNDAYYWKNGVTTSLGTGMATGVYASASGDIYISKGGDGPGYWKNGTLVAFTGNSDQQVNAIAVNGNNVYAVGTNYQGNYEQAMYWKNGVSQYLLQSLKTVAHDIEVSGTGLVYISGASAANNTTPMKVSCWLPPGDLTTWGSGMFVAAATGIALDGTDVYVCGSEDGYPAGWTSTAKYWKNGVPVNLTNGTVPSIALAITLAY